MPKSSPSRSKKPRAGKKAKVRLLSSRTVYRGPVFTITTDHVQEPGGIRVRRDLIHHSGSVVILAVDESGDQSGSTPRVLLERQYRHAAGDYLWELPAGRIDPGEHELKAAKRELLEETGYTAAHWRRILKFYASPGFMAETMSVFLSHRIARRHRATGSGRNDLYAPGAAANLSPHGHQRNHPRWQDHFRRALAAAPHHRRKRRTDAALTPTSDF